ncbi:MULTISPECIES: Bug family tripartite tricarboxylate transporter substrate binding protein [Ramlibacter]|uniref:Tripartite tricarboxylate transporter substrate binding protein n=1 Tax=Ramlibacter pinisoli TaxID=2682844 RepID=A0A6N8IWL6_9BURK|nr:MULTISPECIES: tripartite tricarboxylate transporter substrate binding protein [Ramlibacter]MBA2965524.1 tripartite tricarboxylate transporter substrate binding protein [Ramlibacter sp. CGMCC 1.13660]MVQ30490.1 tripartite tricarboxylate transporter substrate binding protein [Ramlibacter pinisoli]
MTTPSRRRTLLAWAAAAAATGACGLAAAQGFPAKPITLVVPNPPGGLVDGSARLLGEPLQRILGQSVVVDNRGGASGNVAYGMVARAAPDGYTLLTSYSAYHVGNPSLFPKMPWSQADLAPVALITAATNVIAIHPSVPAKTLPEFIAYLKKNPGRLSYASQGNGSLSHVGTEMFKMQTGTSMVHIPYRGSGAAIADVLSGQVQVFMTTPPSVMGHIQAGKLGGLAVTSKVRHPALPQVPTTAEAGLAGFELEAWVAIFAPAGTPPDVVAKLTGAIKQALELPETRTRAAAAGIDLRYLPPADLAALVQRETAFWTKTIQAAKITAD